MTVDAADTADHVESGDHTESTGARRFLDYVPGLLLLIAVGLAGKYAQIGWLALAKCSIRRSTRKPRASSPWLAAAPAFAWLPAGSPSAASAARF